MAHSEGRVSTRGRSTNASTAGHRRRRPEAAYRPQIDHPSPGGGRAPRRGKRGKANTPLLGINAVAVAAVVTHARAPGPLRGTRADGRVRLDGPGGVHRRPLGPGIGGRRRRAPRRPWRLGMGADPGLEHLPQRRHVLRRPVVHAGDVSRGRMVLGHRVLHLLHVRDVLDRADHRARVPGASRTTSHLPCDGGGGVLIARVRTHRGHTNRERRASTRATMRRDDTVRHLLPGHGDADRLRRSVLWAARSRLGDWGNRQHRARTCQWAWVLAVWAVSTPVMQIPSFHASRWVIGPAIAVLGLSVLFFLWEIGVEVRPWECQPGPSFGGVTARSGEFIFTCGQLE